MHPSCAPPARPTRLRQSARFARAPRALPVLMVAGLAGCAPPAGPARLSPPEAARLEEIFYRQAEPARGRFTEADVRFMVGMIAHHSQALEMTALLPGRASHPAIFTLADRIERSQRDEIHQMETWLRLRGQPLPAGGGDHAGHEAAGLHAGHGAPSGGAHHPAPAGDPAHAAHGSMPGMLSPEQLASLAAASGPAFDRLFLELMIQHHQGAVSMVRDLFATDGAGQDTEVFRFASDVQVDQASEIARMERLLASLSPSSPSPGAPE